MPLDVRLERGQVTWSTETAMAFRHGVLDLEDHLMGMGINDAELEVRVRRAVGEGDIHAVLKFGDDRLDVNAEDPNLAYGVTQALERLRSLASPERVLVNDGRGTRLGTDAPWEDVLSMVVAMATHQVTRAVDLGDLPPGTVDPRDLADDALVDVLEEKDRSMRAVRRHLRRHLEKRISRWARRAADVELDAEAPVRMSDDGDDSYAYRQPDEGPDLVEDQLDATASLASDDRRDR